MKYSSLTIILLITLLRINESIAQERVPPVPLPPSEEEIYKVVEEMPRFPGCEDMEGSDRDKNQCSKEKMLEYVYTNLKYPEEARKNLTEGMAVIQFKIWKDSTIRDIKIVRDPGDGTGEEAAKLVASMRDMDQKWRPGHQKGRAVCVQYTMPIKFKLEGSPTSRSRINYNSDIIHLSNVDEEPIFPDCKKYRDYDCTSEKLQEFIEENQLYPEEALKNKTEGTVHMSFVIEKDGTISNIKAMNRLPDGLSKDAIEVIKWMISEEIIWRPGMKDFKLVRTRYAVDIPYYIADWQSRQ